MFGKLFITCLVPTHSDENLQPRVGDCLHGYQSHPGQSGLKFASSHLPDIKLMLMGAGREGGGPWSPTAFWNLIFA